MKPQAKPLRLDYAYIVSRSTDELTFTLTQQQQHMLLALLEPQHWLTRWNLDYPTDEEKDIIDALVSDCEHRLMVEAEVSEGLSPFWDDEDAGDAAGTADVSEYTFSEQVEDWAIAAFIASSGVVGAAATYLTIAPRFRLLFKRADWGGIAKIFIDGELYGEVDTYNATPDVIPFDVVIPT